jgi:hypothetical protein
MVLRDNSFIGKILPGAILRKLCSAAEIGRAIAIWLRVLADTSQSKHA